MLPLNVGTIWAPIKTFYNSAIECWCAEKYSVHVALRHFISYRLKILFHHFLFIFSQYHNKDKNPPLSKESGGFTLQ